MQRNVQCPTGFSGVVRPLKLREANVLADDKLVRSGETLDQTLAACWLETTDPGPYEFPAGGRPNWKKVLIADRFFTILQLRIATHGPEYAFRAQCSKPQCRMTFEWSIHLENDLTIQPMPEEAREIVRAGNRFEARLQSSGKRVVFQLLDGDAEAQAAKQLRTNRHRKVTVAMAARIVEIEGVPSSDKYRFLEDMDLGEMSDLLHQMDAFDGGVETAIDVECPECMEVQEINLPLDKGFWLPKKLT
jgi:hypothetical protein